MFDPETETFVVLAEAMSEPLKAPTAFHVRIEGS